MSHDRLNVRLTATTNPYMTDRLPMLGEIELTETGMRGTLIVAYFRILQPDGRLSAKVRVDAPAFAYDRATSGTIAAMRCDAERAQHAGWTFGHNEELRCPDCGEPLRGLRTGAVGHSGEVCATWTDYIDDRPAPLHDRPRPLLDDRPDLGDRSSLDEALRLAIRDGGDTGAAIEDIEIWIRDNRSGGAVPRQALLARLAQLPDVTEITSPASRKFFLPVPVDQPESIVEAVQRLVAAAVDAHGDAGVTADEAAAWIDANTPGRGHADTVVVDIALGQLVGQGSLRRATGARYFTIAPVRPRDADDLFTWTAGNGTVRRGRVLQARGVTGLLYVEIQPEPDMVGYRTWLHPDMLVLVIDECPDCEGTGQNCLAHRDDVVGKAARSC